MATDTKASSSFSQRLKKVCKVVRDDDEWRRDDGNAEEITLWVTC